MFYTLGKYLIQIIAWIDLFLVTAMVYFLAFLPSRLTRAWYNPLFRYWCWIFIRALGVNLKLHQKNRYSLPKHYILIGNHPSVFEDLGMPALFKARFLAKEEIKDWWILGRISIAAGTLFVKRESRESRKEANETLVKTLLEGQSVALYPEGGCKGRRVYLPFRYGTFDAAIRTGVPIIPVFLHYEAQEEFEWKPNETLIQKLWHILRSPNKTANYYIYDAIDPKQFANKETLCHYVQTLYMRWQAQYLE